MHTRIYAPYDHPINGLGLAVDFLALGIEAVFKLLGSEGSPVKLVIRPAMSFSPGLEFSSSYFREQWSEEVPNHIEKMRRLYTMNQDAVLRVRVIWTSFFYDKELSYILVQIESNGNSVAIDKRSHFESLSDERLETWGRRTCVFLQRKYVRVPERIN
jgi:hypothetical protein